MFALLCRRLLIEVFMLEQMLNSFTADPAGVGQITWDVPGTYQWVVPDDVKSVCCLVIGPGQRGEVNGVTAYGGTGGAVRWKNDIPVTPGSTVTVVVGAAHTEVDGTAFIQSTGNLPSPARTSYTNSSVLGLAAGNYQSGTPLGGGVGGGNGGVYDVTGYDKYNAGGSVGFINTTNGSSGDKTPNRGMNIITTAFLLGIGSYGRAAGGGGGCSPKNVTGGIYNRVWMGGHGAARIIWGKGRAYPGTKVNDQ